MLWAPSHTKKVGGLGGVSYEFQAVWWLRRIQRSLLSWGASRTKRLGAGPEPEMLTFPFNSLFKTVHFQLRLPSLPFREPDPSRRPGLQTLCSILRASQVPPDSIRKTAFPPRIHDFQTTRFYSQNCSPTPPQRPRIPDPSQKCSHFLLILSLKLLIFSSGCLPSLSGSRTRARNAYMSFQFSL